MTATAIAWLAAVLVWGVTFLAGYGYGRLKDTAKIATLEAQVRRRDDKIRELTDLAAALSNPLTSDELDSLLDADIARARGS